MFGIFLFIAQYLQLVLGMGPLEAGIWTFPSGIVFALGSMAAPVLLRYFRPATVITSGFLLAAVGYALLTQLSAVTSPWLMFTGHDDPVHRTRARRHDHDRPRHAASPPERAGAASAVSETSFEFGGALGIAVLGSIMTAIYRGAMADEAIAGLPPHAVEVARDTLGGAVAAAHELSGEGGAKLLATARAGFVHAFEVAAAVSALGALVAAAFAARFLRDAPR